MIAVSLVGLVGLAETCTLPPPNHQFAAHTLIYNGKVAGEPVGARVITDLAAGPGDRRPYGRWVEGMGERSNDVSAYSAYGMMVRAVDLADGTESLRAERRRDGRLRRQEFKANRLAAMQPGDKIRFVEQLAGTIDGKRLDKKTKVQIRFEGCQTVYVAGEEFETAVFTLRKNDAGLLGSATVTDRYWVSPEIGWYLKREIGDLVESVSEIR